MNRAPTSVMVIGIIGIVMAGLALVGMLGTALIIFGHVLPTTPMMESLSRDTGYRVVTMASMVIGGLLTIFGLFACIYALKLRKRARKAMLAYAWISIANLVLGTAMNIIYVLPKMAEFVPSDPSGRAGFYGGQFGAICGSFLGLIYPVCILYFFTRPNVINAFNGIFAASPTDFPVLPPQDGVPAYDPRDPPSQFP